MRQKTQKWVCRAGLLWVLAAALGGPAARAQEYIQDLLSRDEGREFGRVVDVVRRFERVDTTDGLPLGAFRIQPTLSAGMAYDDNIFVTNSHRESDGIGIGKAGATVTSQWSRHQLELFGNLEGGAYISHSDQDFWLARSGANGRLDVNSNLNFDGHVFYGRLIEPRDTPDGVNGLEPTVFHIFLSTVGANATAGRFLFSGRGGYLRIRYDDVAGLTGTIDTEDRDFDEYSGEGRVGYNYLASDQVYLRVRYANRNYVLPFSFDGFARGLRDYSAIAGATFDLGGLIAGEVRAGAERLNFDDARLSTVTAPLADLTLVWNPTRDTTVTGIVGYNFVPSFVEGSPGFNRAQASLRVAHDFSTNVLALGRVVFENRDYVDSSRSEQLYGFDLGAIYRLDRGLFLEGQYLFRVQSGENGGGAYNRNIVLIQARKVF
jgi:hypothetical protein